MKSRPRAWSCKLTPSSWLLPCNGPLHCVTYQYVMSWLEFRLSIKSLRSCFSCFYCVDREMLWSLFIRLKSTVPKSHWQKFEQYIVEGSKAELNGISQTDVVAPARQCNDISTPCGSSSNVVFAWERQKKSHMYLLSIKSCIASIICHIQSDIGDDRIEQLQLLCFSNVCLDMNAT